jgi:hypothetical protein
MNVGHVGRDEMHSAIGYFGGRGDNIEIILRGLGPEGMHRLVTLIATAN